MMDWSRWRNPVHNFVNLTGLYQGPSFKVRPPFRLNGARPGWAYFEDGSVFFPRFPYTNEELQEVMKLAASFVRNPSDGKRTLQRKDSSQTRMILLENYNQHPIFGPGNLHVYGRYVRNGESMLAPSTRFSAVKLELDSTQSTHISTEFNAELTFPDSSFLSIEQWIKSSRTFRGTLVGGVLRPGARLGNGLEFTFSQQSVDPELTPDQKDLEQELRASRLSDETESKRQFQYLKSRDSPSATGLEVPLRSSIDFDIRRGLERFESMEGVPSLDDHEINLKQRETRLTQLSRTLLWEQKQWRERRTPDLKSAADTLGSQWRLETQLESQLERQKAWGRCEDDALKRANLAERERILQAGVEQLKWTQMNWFWFKKCARLEERLKQANKDIQGLKARRERVKKEPRIAVGKGQVKESVSLGEEAKRIGIAMKESKESALPSGDAETVFEFLNEDDRDLPDALELFRRASG